MNATFSFAARFSLQEVEWSIFRGSLKRNNGVLKELSWELSIFREWWSFDQINAKRWFLEAPKYKNFYFKYANWSEKFSAFDFINAFLNEESGRISLKAQTISDALDIKDKLKREILN